MAAGMGRVDPQDENQSHTYNNHLKQQKMAEIVISSTENLRVRTYKAPYAPSDTDSEGEAQFEVETGDEEQTSVSTRLQQNQQFMDEQIRPPFGERSAWVVETQPWKATNDTDVVLIKKPTASNMAHRLLNPFIYRKIQNAGSLNDLAALLKTPEDWETRYNQIVVDGRLITKLNDFRSLADDTAESTIQFRFMGLIEVIADRLDVVVFSDSETSIIVGGILARYQYDLRSKTDPHFLGINGVNLIASEAKTHRTFASDDMWYHGSRGVQVLSALYAFNAPTFLFTQKQWKLFVENGDRNAILTFPYGDNLAHSPHVKSSLVQPMGTTFLKAIVICLLSRRVAVEGDRKAATVDEACQVLSTPERTIVKRKHFDTTAQPTRLSDRLLGNRQPRFVSGYDGEGRAIYSVVRVVPQGAVARIEDDIASQDKKEYQKQTSQSTLFE